MFLSDALIWVTKQCFSDLGMRNELVNEHWVSLSKDERAKSAIISLLAVIQLKFKATATRWL